MTEVRKMPLVAVVVAVFNEERYLEKCLKSLASQSYPNLVVYVVDDGSTDGTAGIVDAWAAKDSRVVAMHQPNSGQGVARNAALSAVYARHDVDYVAFADGDDYVAPNFLQRLVESAQENQSDITVSCFKYFDESGVIDDDRRLKASQCLSKEDFIRLILARKDWRGVNGSGGMVWKTLFKKSVIDGMFFLDAVDCIEDEPFCLEALIRAQKTFYLSEVLYFYHHRHGLETRTEKSDRKHLASRKMCMSLARKVSADGELIAVAYLLELIVGMYRRYQVNKEGLIKYRDWCVKARDAGEISQKVYWRYLLFCDHPVLTKGYFALRRVFNGKKRG